ncbi:MAG: DegT/DnrJ/EryC1/StrS family aminotransferase [Candidatus Woesearchaeota archaeon]
MIPVCEPTISGNELKYVMDCIKTNWISSLGPYIPKFEEGFSRYCGAGHGIACSNGTAALHLALESLGVGKGDEVIIPDLTMIATMAAVLYCGAKPVFVDAEEKTWNLDINKIEEKITDKTKAIIPVHISGHPVDMDKLKTISKRHNLFVVEDAAEAHGAEYKGKRVGGLGDAGCFSFFGNKILTTGEGGMIVTSNAKLSERCKLLRNQAHSSGKKKFSHEELGFNYRLTNLQAAVGCAQLENVDKLVEGRVKNGKYYTELLSGVEGLTSPIEESWAKNVYWMYTLLITKRFGVSRNKVIDELMKRGIQTRPFFVPMHSQPLLNKFGLNTEEKFPVAEKLSEEGIYLPSASHLTKEEIETVAKTLISLKSN